VSHDDPPSPSIFALIGGFVQVEVTLSGVLMMSVVIALIGCKSYDNSNCAGQALQKRGIIKLKTCVEVIKEGKDERDRYSGQ
jgi:hypothetical protein